MTPRAASKPTLVASRLPAASVFANETGLRELVRQIDLEPIGRIVAGDIGVEHVGRPIPDLGAELGLGRGHALGAVDLGEAAGQHRLGFVVERAYKLRLPAVPDAGADGADIRRRQDGEQLHALQRLHHGGEVLDRLAVGEIARLRDRRHDEVHFDQPGDELGVGGIEAQPRTKPAGDARAGDRMILDASLGDVVQEQRHIKHRAMLRLNRLDQLARQRHFAAVALLDLVEHADAAQQMLVHRIMVVHVELHHRHDAAKCAHEFAEHAGLVHAAKHGFGLVLRGQNFQKQAVGFLVVAHLGVDQLQRAGGGCASLRDGSPDCASAPGKTV